MIATSYAYFLGWLRLGTGAIWAPIAGHSAWSALTQESFGAATGGANALLWTGESGILVALVLAPAVFLVVRLWKLPEYLKIPKEPLEAGRYRVS